MMVSFQDTRMVRATAEGNLRKFCKRRGCIPSLVPDVIELAGDIRVKVNNLASRAACSQQYSWQECEHAECECMLFKCAHPFDSTRAGVCSDETEPANQQKKSTSAVSDWKTPGHQTRIGWSIITKARAATDQQGDCTPQTPE